MRLWLLLIAVLASVLPGSVPSYAHAVKGEKEETDTPTKEMSEERVKVRSRARPIKIQISLSGGEASDLDWLKDNLEITKATEVVDVALDLLYWAVKTRLLGHEIASFNPADGTLTTFSYRSVDRVAPKGHTE